ncbi:MAG: Fur family transcriptional regulator [Hyphomicrobiales bacterium]
MAHTDHATPHADLTLNQKLVLDAISGTAAPQSAYDILDKLRGRGLKAPLQVYRALERLMELGLVHKLESLSAFVACQHPAGEGQAATIFLICESCGAVAERTSACVSGDLAGLARQDGFRVSHSNIEIKGRCGRC